MLQFLFDTLLRALDLCLIAVALSAVYSIIKFPNVAIVQYAVAGAFIGMGLQTSGLPLALCVVLACLATAALALALDRLVFARLLRLDPTIALIGSLALSMVLAGIFLLVFGPAAQRFEVAVQPAIRLWGLRLTQMQLITAGLSIAAIAGFALLLLRSALGREMRAVATNPVLAAATGIDGRLVSRVVIGLSGGLAGLGGCLLALRGSVSIDMGMNMMLPVFAAAILGGLGNSFAAVAGAFVIAAAETLVTNVNFGALTGTPFLYLPASYAPAASFALLVAILLIRPRGLFTNEVKRV